MKEFIPYLDTTFEGVLTPIEWNESNEISRYSLFLDNDEEIILQFRNKWKKKFSKLINKRVQLRGHFKYSRNYSKREEFCVSHIKEITDFSNYPTWLYPQQLSKTIA
ncbi:MAG: hypothetical protein CME63_13185 [Halobacteriovoraceae bacterium]|jgi:hypothetical protein|nr:hypothetical protein [Halobacteriovoraceae bacterium]|tara:strand:+ start:4593 stop:4913 length:321 start_codon:yes stop_codon:yes gene_type:complete